MRLQAENRFHSLSAALLAAAALFVMLQTLFGGETIGLSNNADFQRVMAGEHLEFLDGSPSFVFLPAFRIDLTPGTPAQQMKELLLSVEQLSYYPSIHHVFVRAAVALCYLLGSRTVFSIAWLGALYCVLYALLIWALFASFRLRRTWADLAVKCAAVVVLCDVGYTAYFNSLYSEPVQMLAMLAMFVCLLRLMGGRRPLLWYGLFCLSSVVFGWAKFANIPVSVLAMVCVGAALARIRGRRGRIWCAGAAAASLAVLAAVLLIVPSWMSEDTDFNAVFYGALKDVPTEDAQIYARELGLEEYASLAGYHSYIEPARAVKGTDAFRDAFHVGKVRMTLFYLRHPGLFLEKLSDSVDSAGWVRPYYLSNYGEGHPRLSLSGRFSLWSALRERTALDDWWLNLALLAAAVALLRPLLRGRERGGWWFVCLSLLLVGAFVYDLISPVICNGEADLAKHMFSLVQLVDLLALFDLAAALFLLSKGSGRGLSAAVLALLAVLLLYPLGERAVTALRENAAHDAPEPGSFVALGRADGEELLWRVTETDGEAVTLLAVSPVAEAAFSPDNSSLWSESALRVWLNGAFLDRFSPAERACLLETKNRFVLCQEYHEQAEDGDRPMFAFHTPAQAARGEDAAWAAFASDTVFLPDLATLCGELRRGAALPACWAETPYDANSQMLRVLSGHGALSMRDASETYPVLPCVRVSGAVASGSGSRSDPFRLEP